MAVSVDALAEKARPRFPIFERLTYINSCSQGALSDAVRDAYARYLADWDEHGAPWEYWVAQLDAGRRSVAGLLNAGEDEIAITTSVSAGVDALTSALSFDGERDKIVLSDFEFPTIGQISHAQERRGARVEHVPADADGTIPLERFEAAIDERTALVAITHVCFRNGARLDVEAVAALAHERGVPLLLDAYQSVGSLPVDVRTLGCDFLVAGALKYLLGSAGLAFFYCRRDLVEQLYPTATGWFADRDIFEMDIRDYSPAPTARRFEAGTPPVPAIYAAIAGVELMREIGIEETEKHVRGLTERLLQGVDELGAVVVTPRAWEHRGALTCIASTDAEQLVAALGEQGIVTSSRDGNLRISPHCYNSAEDVEVVLEGLRRHRGLLRESCLAPPSGKAGMSRRLLGRFRRPSRCRSRQPVKLADAASPDSADSRIVVSDVLAFVRSNLPAPPARVLEIGAGNGELAEALAIAGYEVVAIDPEPGGTNVRACALHALDEPAASFDAAIAIVSLHHVDPLAESLRRLAEVLKPAGTVLVDEFDVGAFDVSAAAWWLERQHTLSAEGVATAEELVDEHRAHLHPLHRIAAALESRFHVGIPVRGAYLYRWDLGESYRKDEENSIARAQIPAVGARLVALRTP